MMNRPDSYPPSRTRTRRRGATMAMLAILMPVMIGVAAFAINVVYMEMTRTELQISMDIAARAAGRTLAVTEDQQQAIAAAENMLALNPYANQTLTLSETDLEFGVSTRLSDAHRYDFAPGSTPNAVRLATNGTNDVPALFPTMGISLQHRPLKATICTKAELDISLVIDRSGSMSWDVDGNRPDSTVWQYGDPAPENSRWMDAISAVNLFLAVMEDSIHEERVSLTTYASKATTDVGLTGDYQAIRNALDVHTESFNGGSTAIGDGIIDGTRTLTQQTASRPWATRIMIVMTDGIQTTGTDALYAAQQAADDYVMIYTVTFSNEADQAAMQEVAAAAAGKHYHADDSEQLNQVFEDIARGLPTLLTF